MFRSVGEGHLNQKIRRVKTALEHVGLYVGLALYTAAGAKVFQLVENPAEMATLQTYQALLVNRRQVFLGSVRNESRNSADYDETLSRLLEEYEVVVDQAIKNNINVRTQDYTISWDYIQAVFFSTTILTTIGYGNIAPKTFSGRLFSILFAIVGIPFTLSVIADVGQIFATLVSKFWGRYKDWILPLAEKFQLLKSEDDEEEDMGIKGNLYTVAGALIFLSIFLSCGAFFFTLWEDWSFFDAFYYCFITMTTIGFGDIVPDIIGGYSEKTAYMLLSTVYILVGMSCFTTIIELVRRQYAESWRKMQELRAQIQAQLRLAETLKRLSEHAEKNGLELELDTTGNADELKRLLAKARKNKHGTRRMQE